jgi:hypothetical protein
LGDAAARGADYGVACGAMNVKLDIGSDAWEDFIVETLRAMSRTSRRGFAVNFLDPIPVGPISQGLYRTAALATVLRRGSGDLRSLGQPR